MRNFRKTRKRGGAGIVFHCLPKRTATKTCINDFAASNGFTFTNAPPDGNCFFHTLHMYFKNRQDPVALADASYYEELRRVVIDYLAAHIGDYAAFGLTAEDVDALRGDGAWDENAGDYVVPSAAAALSLQINLYDLQDPVPGRAERLASGVGRNAISYMPAVPPTPKHIVHHEYPEIRPAGWVQRGVIHIMRMGDSHFGLLEPVAAPAPAASAVPKKRGKPKVAPAAAPSPPLRAPSPPKAAARAPSSRLTARQQAAAAAKAAKAAAAPVTKAPSPPKSAASRRTVRKPTAVPSKNTYAQNLQAALLASSLSTKNNEARRKQQEKNNANLARALAMSLGNQFAHGSNVFD